MLQKKIDTNAKIAECQVDQKVCKHMQDTYKITFTSLEETKKE